MGKIKKDSLGDRQKSYEKVQEHYLVPKMPFIIRVDGKAFHTYTRGFKKPFDNIMGRSMKRTMQSLCEDIPGAVLGYTQSDEITIVCKYTDRIKSQAWFGGRVEKIIAITASKATKYFNKYFIEEVERLEDFNREKSLELSKTIGKYGINSEQVEVLRSEADLDSEKLYKVYLRKIGEAEFDSRVFNIPEWDCINNVIWRQQDCIRNSVEMVGHANFSAKELNKVNCEGIKDKLKHEKGIDWLNDFTPYQRVGAFCYKLYKETEYHGVKTQKSIWVTTDNKEIIVQNNRDWFSIVTGLSED